MLNTDHCLAVACTGVYCEINEVYVEFGNKSLYVDTKRSVMAYKFNGDEVVERGIQSGEG